MALEQFKENMFMDGINTANANSDKLARFVNNVAKEVITLNLEQIHIILRKLLRGTGKSPD